MQAKTPLRAAEDRALEALKVETATDSVLVFRQRTPLKAGTVIRQAGTAKPVGTKANKRGVRRTTAPVAVRVPKDEPAWFFYSDEGPFQAYQHPGRVVLVGVESGEVTVSKTMQWPPVIGGKLPEFMRSAAEYRNPANRIFYRLYEAVASANARGGGGGAGRVASGRIGDDRFGAASQAADEMALRQRAADSLAEEGSCVIRFGETLGNFYDFSSLSQTVVGFGGLFNGLERLNPGFKSSRYGLRSGLSPLAYVQRAIDRGNCRDVLLYLAGSGYEGRTVVNFGLRPRRGGKVDVQELSAAQLRRFTRRNDDVTFKLIADAPYAGGLGTLVDGEENVLIVQTPGQSTQPSFRFIPGILGDGQILRNLGNSMGLLEFTNRLRIGFERFLSSRAEVDHAASEAGGTSGRRFLQSDTGQSFLVWALDRAFDTTDGDDFAKKIGKTDPIDLVKGGHESSAPPGSPGPPGDVNDPPVATAQVLNAVEDTPRAITLAGTDPDGDALGFEIVTPPAHGALSGTLPNVTYTPAANYNGTDGFTFRVGDGVLTSAPAAVSLDVAAANDAPALTASAGSLAFTENSSAATADPGLTVTDIDSAISGASVKIADGFVAAEDALALPSHPAISGAYNSATGVLTLTGSASPSDYQAALRTVTFRNTGDDPTASRRLDFSVTDGALSGGGSRNVAITAVNDLPVVDAANATLPYVEGDGQVPIDPALNLADADDDQMAGATAQITGNHAAAEDELAFTNAAGITGAYDDATGKLTLSGTASRADYQAALRSITYENGSGNPSTAARTVTFTVTDGTGGTGAGDARDIAPAGANDLATVATSSGTAGFTEDGAPAVIDGDLTLADADDAQLEGARVAIVSGFQAGDELLFGNGSGITGSYNSGTGVLTLTGSASVGVYRAALRSVGFDTPSQDPAGPKTIEFRADDGDGLGPAATRNVAVTRVNDNPVLNATGPALAYTEGDGAVAVDNALTVSDVDSAQLTGATVQITSNHSAGQDALAFVDTAAITGAYNSATGTLTLAGADTVANYQAALRSVRYENSSDDPSTAARTVSFRVDDGSAANNLSNVATRDVGVSGSNDAPVVATSAGSAPFTEDGAAVVVAGGLTVTDVDDSSLESAQVRISSGFQSGDSLVFVDQSGITGNYNSGTGVLALTGTASLSDYQAALRSVEFDTIAQDPAASKTVEFTANDGGAASVPATKGVAVTAVNDAPSVSTTGSALAYSEDAGPVAVDGALTAADVDSATLSGAAVQITSNFDSAEDRLAFVDTTTISGSYNAATGVLVLTGTDSVANYQAALRSVTYENTDTVAPSAATRTVSFQADDGAASGNLSNVATRDVTVSTSNDAPIVITSAGDTSYTEGNAGTTIDGALTVSDEDDANLEGAQVRISSGFESGDDLTFVNTPNITGLYNTGTGVLTLSGTDTVANYQAALRSVTFDNTVDDDLASPKTIEFKANDGDADSNLATKNIAVTPVNDAPTLSTTGAALAYSEGDGAVAVDNGITASDPDSTQLQGATVQITSNFASADDQLAFADTANITGSYNDSTGTLTLSGTDTLANYQAALRSVTYENVSDNPSGSKTVSLQATDAEGAASNVATRDINLAGANDAPVATTSAGSTSYVEGATATTVDGALTVADADDSNLESAEVRIAANFESGDDLVFVNTATITGLYNTGTGVLTLSGTDTVANYQAALRSIAYSHVGDNPSSGKQVEFKVNDGDADSNGATKGINITRVNDAPTLNTTGSALSYSEGNGAVAVDGGLTLSDPDSTQVQGATVQITSNFVSADDGLAFADTATITGVYNDSTGTLTLSGNDTLANYQTALRTVTYENVNDNPSGTKTVSFQATDAEGAASNVATRDVNVAGTNDAPVVTTSAGDTSYTEGDPATTIDGSLIATDADDANLEAAQVRISSGFQSGDDLVFVNTPNITGNYTSGTGVLTLTGTDTVANYQAALRSIEFQTVNDNPVTSKTVEFKANDGAVDSNLATKNISVTRVNDAPTVNTTGAALSYTEGDGAVAFDPGLTVTDPDSTQLQGATVQITGNHVQANDELAFAAQNGITGAYNDSTGTMTLSGSASVANYQTALRSITYENSSDNPSGSKTLSVQVTDAEGAASNVATRDINLTGANDAPVVNTSAGDTSYTEGDPATTIDGALTLSDADDTNMESAQVRISSGFQSGDDLVFVNQNGVSGVYNSGTGVLTMTGTASLADYQTAFRSVQFQTTNDAPVGSKTVEFKANDGDVDSNSATKQMAVTPTNDAPTLNTSAGNAAFTEDLTGPVAADPNLTLTDPDSTDMQGATAEITTGFNSSEDQLVFVDTANISGVYNSGTGVLTLSGADTVANYQAALRSVQYNNTDMVAPDTATRTVHFQATDAEGAASNFATRNVNVASVNDAPVVNTTAGSTPYTEDDPATTVDGGVTVSDQDDTNLEGGQARISSGFQSGDSLVFVNQNGISGVYNTGTGVLTLTGTASVANYQTALRTIQFQSTNQQPVTSKTVELKVNDGDADSNLATKEIAVTPTNDAPVVTAGGTLSYTENDPATAIHSGLTIVDTESDNLSGASASITANYASGQDDLNWTDNNLADNITLDGVNSSDQTIVLTGLDTDASYRAALRAVTYTNTSDNPATSSRTVTFSATDQPGLTGSDTRTISVTAVDDPPTGVNDSATLLEDAPATSVPVLTNDTDVDGGPKTISGATDPANGTVVLTGGSPGAHTGLTYQPDPNYCNDPPGTTPDTFNYTLNGGSSATVSMTVTCVNDAPVADDETFNGNDSAHGNTTLQVDDPDDDKSAPTNPHTEITGDILAGDTDIDGPGPMTVTTGTFATNDGGSVTLESDGDFVFQPAASTSCTDTSDFFDYTVEDSGSPEQTDTGRVTIAISGCVWYVNNNAAGNSGTSNAPYDTLAQAETASGSNHTVFVYDGDNANTGYATGFQMNSGERLIGEHEGLTVDPDQGGGLTADTLHPANQGAHPTLSATSEDVVQLDDGNELRGFDLNPSGAFSGIAGASGDTGGATIDDVRIIDTGTAATNAALELISTTGTFNVSNLTVDNTAASGQNGGSKGIELSSAGTVNFSPTGTISITTTGGAGLSAISTNLGTSTFDTVATNNSSTGGVELVNTTNPVGGSTTFGDLDLTTTSGSVGAFDVSSGGTIVVPSGGAANVHATGGPGVDVTSTTGAQLNFDDVDSTNSSGAGINLSGLGSGVFNASSGTITGAAGISFDVNDGDGAITYPGSLNNGSGPHAVQVTSRDGGTVTIGGPLADTNDAGGGIDLSSNTGGSTVLSNGTKQINTTGGASAPTNQGVVMTASDGHTLTLSGGGLDIDTTNGKGLEADTSGTIEVSGSGNTIDTTTGRALNISDTDIASNDVTLQRVSSNGASNGIRLNNTANSAGRLFITSSGSGTCTSAAGCTGGFIQNATGTGVVLNSVPGGAEFMRVGVQDSADHGIHGNSVAGGILLDRSFINSNGNTAAGTGENGLEWTDVQGVSAIRHSDIIGTGVQNEGNFGARISNTTGTLNLTVNDNDFTLAGTDDALQVGAHGTATIRTSITGNRFDDNKGEGIQIVDGVSTGITTDHTITGNTIDGKAGTATDGGMAISSDGSARVSVTNNTVTNVSVSGIVLNPLGTGAGTQQHMTATNNTIGTTGVQQSGSADGDGMQLKSGTDGVAKVVMSNNQIHGWQGAGMRMRTSESTNGASTHLTAQGNTMGAHESGAADAAIWLQAGSSTLDVINFCANVLSNTFTGGPVNAPAGIADFVLDMRFANSTMRVPNYTGTTLADRQNYFLGRNTGFSNFAQDGTQNMQNEADGSCDQPTSPTAPIAPPTVGS